MTLNKSILTDFFPFFSELKVTCIGKLLVDPFSKQIILYIFTVQLTLQIRESKFQTANKVGKYLKCQGNDTLLAYSSLLYREISDLPYQSTSTRGCKHPSGPILQPKPPKTHSIWVCKFKKKKLQPLRKACSIRVWICKLFCNLWTISSYI